MIYPLNAPLLDLLILSILRSHDSYGYEIGQHIKSISNMKDSTLYPILKRLSDYNYVETYDLLFQGRNRKYYKITKDGQIQLENLKNEWSKYIQEIELIICGEYATAQNGGNRE